MKGIYLVGEELRTSDLYWICRARGIFEEVVVALELGKGMLGVQRSNDVSRIRNVLDSQGNLSVNFYKVGEDRYFLSRLSYSGEIKFGRRSWFGRSGFRGVRDRAITDLRLIVPSVEKDKYRSLKFKKYFL